MTGATGFIGRRCLAPLKERGFEVHVISSRDMPVDADVQVTWHTLDLLGKPDYAALLREVCPSHLLHAAWFAKPGAFWSSDENFRWLACSAELFRAFYLCGGERAVGVGTCAEYKWVVDDCSEERTPLRPDSVYGCCKLAASLVLDAARRSAGKSAAWARLFFPYGPGEPEERFIPSLISGLLSGRSVECTHGNQVRDFVHVDDVAAALVALLLADESGTFNVGSGNAASLRDVADTVCRRLGNYELVRFGTREAPPGDPQRVIADTEKMRNEIGWQSEIGLEQGIDNAIAAWQDRLQTKGTG